MDEQRQVSKHRLFTLVAVSLVAGLAACSATTGSGQLADDSGDATLSGSGGGGLTSTADGAGGNNLSVGSGSSGDDDDACASESHGAEVAPVDITIMLDRSGSMGGSRWSAVTGALNNFVQSPDAAGLGVSLQYFPIQDSNANMCDTSKCTDCGCVLNTCPGCSVCSCINNVCQCNGFGGSMSCDVSDYAMPDVPMGTLPQAASAITASLAAHSPDGGTPTHPALAGAIDYATSWASANPSRKAAVVLATDGKPTACDPTEIPAISSLASNALNAAPSVPTFVIGVGNELTDLNAIAAAGGTTQAYLVDANQNAGDEFLKALKAIQNAVLACEYLIPDPKQGDPDYDKVNVEYTPSNGPPETIPQVPDGSQCGGLPGWYYDNPNDPAKIILCPASCDAAQDSSGATLSIVLGCKTVVK